MAHRGRGRRPSEVAAADIPVVGPREPCPCGSGRRYKACHGRGAARSATTLVARPFEGLAGEAEWVALRELVPAGTAPLVLRAPHADRVVQAVSLLPAAAPALVRSDGSVQLALQTASGSGDPSRDLAAVLERALGAAPGSVVTLPELPGPGARLQDLLDPAAELEVTVHDGYGYWLDDADGGSDEDRAAVERAREVAVPTRRLGPGAYWCRIGGREHVRWVVAVPEERLLDALARLHGRGADGLGDGTRLLGTFRAHGLLVPVWDLAPGTDPDAVGDAVRAFETVLDAALTEDTPLTSDERRARAGLANRQVTLR